jgi:hypothetical protein
MNYWRQLSSSPQWSQIKDLTKSAYEKVHQETDRYKQYSQKNYQNIKSSIGDTSDRLTNATKYHIKHSPIYGFKLIRIGGYYMWQLVKIGGKTKFGTAIKMTIGCYFLGRATYVYGSQFTRDVTIERTFQRFGEDESDGINGYMFSDSKNRIYRVTNSPWFFQFYSTEMWADIKEKTQYHVRGYGLRLPALRIYPNVVHIEPYDEAKKKREKYEKHKEETYKWIKEMAGQIIKK